MALRLKPASTQVTDYNNTSWKCCMFMNDELFPSMCWPAAVFLILINVISSLCVCVFSPLLADFQQASTVCGGVEPVAVAERAVSEVQCCVLSQRHLQSFPKRENTGTSYFTTSHGSTLTMLIY